MTAPYALALKNTPTAEVVAALNDVRFPYEVAIYGTENGFNFGAVLRTGNAFLCRRYYAIDMDAYYRRAAMTAHKYEKGNIDKCSTTEFLERTAGRDIVVFEKREGVETVALTDFVFPRNCILLFGNEKTGVPAALLERANHVVSIPMYGTVWDLNIALAAGIAMHAVVSQFTRGNK